MQEQPSRPFSLNVLTGLTFGVAIWNLLAMVQFIAFIVTRGRGSGLSVAIQHSLMSLPGWTMYFLIAGCVIKAPLLFLAAWGYFNFKRLGRWAGNAYAGFSLAESAVIAFGLDYPVGLTTVVGILFAAFTLAAVNGPFRPLLTR